MAINRGVVSLAQTHGLVDSQLRAMNNLSAGLQWEDPRAGQNTNREGIEVARRRGNRGWLLQYQQGLASFATFTGGWDEADRILAEMAGPDLPTLGKVVWASVSANLHAFRGEIAEAAATLAEVADVRSTADDPRNAGYMAIDDAFVELMAGRLDQAYTTLVPLAAGGLGEVASFAAMWAARAALWMADAERARRASELFDVTPERGRFINTSRLAIRAGVKALEGDREGALAGYREATRLFREMDLEFEVAFMGIELATLLGPDEPEAVAAGEHARAYWTRLGSPPLLAQLDTGLARWAKPPTGRQAAAEVGSGAARDAAPAEPAGATQ
jgi:hypothetical protein